MPEPEPEDPTRSQSDPAGDSSSHSSPPRESRRMRITPEQRRFLGPARSRHDWVGADEAPEQTGATGQFSTAIPQKTTEEEYAPHVHESPPASASPMASETTRPV